MKEIYIITIIIILLIILLLVLSSHFRIDITRYNIKNKKIDKNIKLLFLSDLHNREIGSKLEKIIDTEKPDIVIFGGDMVNEHIGKINNFLKLNETLSNQNKYYIFGNHEHQMSSSDFKKYDDITDKLDLKKLNNKHEKLSNNIIMYGLVSEYEKYKKFKKTGLDKEYIESKIGKFDLNKFNILIAHNPLEFDSYVDTKADLVLSGHVHGGLIILPLIGALFSPDYTFFPKYYKDSYTKDNTKMIVSRGLGYSARIPIRINNPGEVVIINLMKE